MKLTDFKNEDAVEVLADILEPASTILADEEVKKIIKSGKTRVVIAKEIMKSHSSEIIEILATLDGKTVEEYSCNPVTILMSLIAMLNDKELIDFFTSQATEMQDVSFTSVAENTQANEQ